MKARCTSGLYAGGDLPTIHSLLCSSGREDLDGLFRLQVLFVGIDQVLTQCLEDNQRYGTLGMTHLCEIIPLPVLEHHEAHFKGEGGHWSSRNVAAPGQLDIASFESQYARSRRMQCGIQNEARDESTLPSACRLCHKPITCGPFHCGSQRKRS